MTERRRPHRRGRGPRPYGRNAAEPGEPNPYRDTGPDAPPDAGDNDNGEGSPPAMASIATDDAPTAPPAPTSESPAEGRDAAEPRPNGQSEQTERPPHREHRQHRHPRDQREPRGDNGGRPQQQQFNGNGRRNRRNRGRGRQRDHQQQPPPTPVVADSETLGWFDPSRDGGFIRRAANSYLAEQGDAYVAPQVVRQHGLRKGDMIAASTGRDHRGRPAVVEVLKINDQDPATAARRPDFGSLTATYPERKLHLE